MYYKIAENEFSRDFLTGIKNSVSALFYIENLSNDELEKEIDTIAELVKKKRPEEVSLLMNWLRLIFNSDDETIQQIIGPAEAKTMLRKTVEKMKKEIRLEGMQEGMQRGIEKGVQKGIREKSLETASALLKKKMSAKEIAEITGLSVEEIKKLG